VPQSSTATGPCSRRFRASTQADCTANPREGVEIGIGGGKETWWVAGMAKTNHDGPQARLRDLALKQEDDWCTNAKISISGRP
jgi:hypothetical protein